MEGRACATWMPPPRPYSWGHIAYKPFIRISKALNMTELSLPCANSEGGAFPPAPSPVVRAGASKSVICRYEKARVHGDTLHSRNGAEVTLSNYTTCRSQVGRE